VKFTTTILQGGKTATGIVVPDAVVEALGGGKRAKVAVTLNGYTYRSSLAVMGGRTMVGVSGEVRERAGVAGGDTLEVDVVLDTAPREVAVPAALAEALASDPAAKAKFESLSYSGRLRHALDVETAKTPETLAKRLVKVMTALRA
jgi:hypothetical protein